MSRVLVYQANSVQGSATARAVQQAGYTTRVLIRNRSTEESLLKSGFEVAVADLLDREALRRAHESVDQVVLQIPAYSDAFASQAIDNAASALETMGVQSAVIKMANPTPARSWPNSGFSVNAILLDRMRTSAVPFCVVEPTMYLDTFLKPNFRHEIGRLHVIDLPLPEGLRVAWTTVDDAAWLAALLLRDNPCGGAVRCAGAESHAGPELAAMFSAVLNKKIDYRATPIEEFQREIEAAIGPGAAAPVVAKFRLLSGYPDEAANLLSHSHRSDLLPNQFTHTRARDWIWQNRSAFDGTTSVHPG